MREAWAAMVANGRKLVRVLVSIVRINQLGAAWLTLNMLEGQEFRISCFVKHRKQSVYQLGGRCLQVITSRVVASDTLKLNIPIFVFNNRRHLGCC